jgi:hypothetical protein
MLKFITPIAIVALTVIAIAPKSQAIPINVNSISFEQSSRYSQPQVIVKIGSQPEYHNHWEVKNRRELELKRARAAAIRRYQYSSRHNHSRDYQDRNYREYRYNR